VASARNFLVKTNQRPSPEPWQPTRRALREASGKADEANIEYKLMDFETNADERMMIAHARCIMKCAIATLTAACFIASAHAASSPVKQTSVPEALVPATDKLLFRCPAVDNAVATSILS
jgi:hypothetical protein